MSVGGFFSVESEVLNLENYFDILLLYKKHKTKVNQRCKVPRDPSYYLHIGTHRQRQTCTYFIEFFNRVRQLLKQEPA